MKYLTSLLVVIMILGLAFAIPTMAAEEASKTMRMVRLELNPNHHRNQDANAQIIIEDWTNWSTNNSPSMFRIAFKIRINELDTFGHVLHEQDPEVSPRSSYVLNIYDSYKKLYRILTFNTDRNKNYDVVIWYADSPIAMPFDPINDELFIEIVQNKDDGDDPCGWCSAGNPEALPSSVVLFAHVLATE